MNPSVPQSIDIAFILLTFFLFVITVFCVRTITEDRKITLRVFLSLFFWLLFLKTISGMAFLHNYQSMPPRLMIAPLPCLIAIIVLASSKSFAQLLRRIPMHWLIYIQCYRIFVELILYSLAENGIIHHRMTFAGANFDILAGISALLIGWMVQKKKLSPNGLIAWNVAGILLLLNIVGIAILSTPYPISIFHDEPVNTVIFYFPFIWLPGFVAPFALAMHVFAIKKVLDEKKSPV